MTTANKIAHQAQVDQAGWLEDVLAGLLINGVAPDDIGIQHHPEGRMIVTVRGVPKYESHLIIER